MITFFGFLLDWLITRNWRPVFMLLALPVILLVALLITGVWGALLNKSVLAEKYLSIGERELGDTGQDWAFDLSALNKDAPRDSSSAGADSIPRFTEAVFQRVKQLQGDNPRATYVIGAIMGQKGAVANAIYTMKSIAPDSRAGYFPAHAWIANLMLMQKPFPKEQLPVLDHHLKYGAQWEAAPAHILAAAVQRLRDKENNDTAALELLRTAAEKQPDSEALFRLAVQMNNPRVANETATQVLPRLLALVEDGTATTSDRIALADVLYFLNDFEAARGALEAGLKTPGISASETAALSRALSDYYRLRFEASRNDESGSWNVGLLDQAMRTDPTNPKVAEQVAFLARIGGNSPPDALIKQLKDFLAEGSATPLTHAWLAEAYILRNDYTKAIDHLRSVIARMPNAAKAHNNLAYAISISQPKEQLEEALEHVETAIALNPSDADFHDTMCSILLKLGRTREAVKEIDIAVELDPKNESFHMRAAEAYNLLGEKDVAQAHLEIARKIAEEKSKKELQPK